MNDLSHRARRRAFCLAPFMALLVAGCAASAAAQVTGQPDPSPSLSQPAAEQPGGAPPATSPPAPAHTPASATASPGPTQGPATATPTAQSIAQPTLGYYNITPAPDATLATPFPTPVAPLELDPDLINVLLIGTDYRASQKSYRTDTLILVSIDRHSGMVTLVSIPRDLYVYIPTWGMSRINKAYNDGQVSQYPGGGPGLLKQTLLYNLGVPVHYYALVNFAGFSQIVDRLGGIDVPVNCTLTEYKIKDLALDESDPANYELYTQAAGVAHMDGPLALWYARARPVGGDFFRSYRQRQVLRSVYRSALQADLIPQIPALYGDFRALVETDLGLWDVMQFAPLAASLGDAQIRSLNIGPNQTTGWRTPRGEEVLLPRPEAIQALAREAFSPPSANQLQRPVIQVEVWNLSSRPDLAVLAAETLANEGFVPVIGQPQGGPAAVTQLMDFTTSAKGSPLKRLQSFLRVEDRNVLSQPDAASPVQFRLLLGDDYDPCPRLDWLPEPTATPAP